MLEEFLFGNANGSVRNAKEVICEDRRMASVSAGVTLFLAMLYKLR
jgi:hypothetical protein